jgi:hypothetical protein
MGNGERVGEVREHGNPAGPTGASPKRDCDNDEKKQSEDQFMNGVCYLGFTDGRNKKLE